MYTSAGTVTERLPTGKIRSGAKALCYGPGRKGSDAARAPRAGGAESSVHRRVAIVLLLATGCAGAADFQVGLEAYDRGDYASALREWRALAEQGDATAQYQLGVMYDDGEGVLEDDREAARWYRRAAEQGYAAAQLDLGLMYATGRGVAEDDRKAAYWYRQVAGQGYASAQYRLGEMYQKGEGVREDAGEAARWYRQAAEQGYAAAQLALGAIYAAGRGVAEDRLQAWAWYDLAAAQGNDAARQGRARVERGMSSAQLDEARKLRGALGGPPAADWGKEGEAPVPPPEMVLITGGCFRMGSPESEAGRAGNEHPHWVCIEDFSLARYETTRGEYAAFVRATGRRTNDPCQVLVQDAWTGRGDRNWQEPGYAQADTHPVTCVSLADALAFARWISEETGRRYRLPSEAEWEYAARAGTENSRYWGNSPADACAYANVGDRTLKGHYADWKWTIHHCHDAQVHTLPVGSYRANGYGLHDMLGNVWEWTCSAYDEHYQGSEKRCDAGSGPGVVRGGSWSNSPRWVRSAGRFPNDPEARLDIVGFRLARD